MRCQTVRAFCSTAFLIALAGAAPAQQPEPLPVDLTGIQPTYAADHLKLGGRNATGGSIELNQYYLTIDGVPSIPVMGEFHYYRYPRAYWEEQLRKMKAGGVNVVATYAHWIVHEEREGVWDFSGDRDLRAFIELCGKVGMKVILRVGPYGHGEVRSGGFPDWLLGRPVTVRSNDPEYLRYVSILYRKLGEQIRGQFFKDGGPIIAVQLDNELQHSASPWALQYPGQPSDFTVAPADRAVTRSQIGTPVAPNPRAESGTEHMRKLKQLAQDAGMDVPIWTATGWGNAAIIPNETLPVQAAYAYPSWGPIGAPSPFYTYTDLQQDPDYAPVAYKATDYPYMAAELGPGMINNYMRRPHVPPESVDALVNRFLGSGANGIGYYMFQSGTTPRGERSYLADEANGYPHMSYDFGGPLGEFGQVKPTFNRLKMLHFFMQSFGDRLAPGPVVLPANAQAIQATDTAFLRYAARGANGSGFLFINNFQDHVANTPKSARFTVRTPQGELPLPAAGNLAVPAGANLILPLNFDMDGVRLLSATVQPLAKLATSAGAQFVFFGHDGVDREFSFPGGTTVRTGKEGCTSTAMAQGTLVRCAPADIARFEVQQSGRTSQVLLLDQKSAEHSWIVGPKGRQSLVLSAATPIERGDTLSFRSVGDNAATVRIFPALHTSPTLIGSGRIRKLDTRRGFAGFELIQRAYVPDLKTSWVAANKLSVDLPNPELPDGIADLWLDVAYEADTAMAFVNGELVADHFYAGAPWSIGLKRFLGRDKTMLFYFRPLLADLPFYPDLPNGAPTIAQGEQIIRADRVTLTPEYETTIRF